MSYKKIIEKDALYARIFVFVCVCVCVKTVKGNIPVVPLTGNPDAGIYKRQGTEKENNRLSADSGVLSAMPAPSEKAYSERETYSEAVAPAMYADSTTTANYADPADR